MPKSSALRARQRLGKYRIEKKLSSGERASIYRAYDTIHAIPVALKVVTPEMAANASFLEEFTIEARLSTRMEHPNVLAIQNASFVDDYFVIAMPLGLESLADRITRRMSTDLALSFTEQAIAAVAHAHRRKIIHCDIKPENFIVFPDNRLKLSDFGFSKVAQPRLKASGSGTVGYVAPEQAVGHPMFQSDVFSLSLLIYQLFSGKLPEWPYSWPPAGIDKVRRKLRPKTRHWLRKGMAMRPQDRYRNAVAMENAFHKIPRLKR